MWIKTVNDGKGKAQSFESTLNLYSTNSSWGCFNVEFSGYGANKWSSEQNLIAQAKDLREVLNQLIEKHGG
jgi:hypothetical protein